MTQKSVPKGKVEAHNQTKYYEIRIIPRPRPRYTKETLIVYGRGLEKAILEAKIRQKLRGLMS